MNEDQPTPNPWTRNLLVWGGIFLALFVTVSLFNNRGESNVRQIAYSDFRARVAEGVITDAAVSETKITGHFKTGEAFSTLSVPHDPGLTQLMQDKGVRYSGKAPEEPNMLLYVLAQALPFVLILGVAFLDHPAEVQYRNTVGEYTRQRQIVGDEKRCDS